MITTVGTVPPQFRRDVTGLRMMLIGLVSHMALSLWYTIAGDFNPNVPADDPTDANNDHVYVLPVNSSYIEMNGTVPSTSSMTYPSSGFGTSTGWTNMALNNTNDAVQTIDPE